MARPARSRPHPCRVVGTVPLVRAPPLADDATDLQAGPREVHPPPLRQLSHRPSACRRDREVVMDEIEAGYAPSSVHRHYRTFRRMLQVAVVKEKILANPFE